MTLSEWKAEGHYFSYKNHQIFVNESGSGETLLLIHGFPTASWDWQQMWPHLAKDYHVIAADFLGFGFSDKPRNYPYSILDQADLLESLMREKGVEKVHIISHDYGDTVAQELLARFQSRKEGGEKGLIIQSLCLLNGGLFPEVHRPPFGAEDFDESAWRYCGTSFQSKKVGQKL